MNRRVGEVGCLLASIARKKKAESMITLPSAGTGLPLFVLRNALPRHLFQTIFFSSDQPSLSALTPLQSARYSNSKMILPFKGSSSLTR